MKDRIDRGQCKRICSRVSQFKKIAIAISVALFILSCDPKKLGSAKEMAIITTPHGDITVGLFSELAPKHVESFIKLAKSGFYDGTTFHRVIPGFMIQGGDPNSKDQSNRRLHGTGGPGYAIPAEFSERKHLRGILSAARSSDPNSAGSQFFIMVADSPHLDGQYSIFGEVLKGMEVVDAIVAEERDSRDNPLNPMVMSIRVKN